MEAIVLWMVEWDSSVKALRGPCSAQFIDPLMWREKAEFGRARHVGINLFAIDTQLRYSRDPTVCSFIHLLIH